MAGLGRKVFTRETLSSADVNGYLMDQVVMAFASAAARTAAIPAPTDGMVTYLADVDRLDVYYNGAWNRFDAVPGAWQSLALTNVGSGLAGFPTRCRLEGPDTVRLEIAANGPITAGATMVTLPVGMRPGSGRMIAATNGGTGTHSQIGSGGAVTCGMTVASGVFYISQGTFSIS